MVVGAVLGVWYFHATMVPIWESLLLGYLGMRLLVWVAMHSPGAKPERIE
jgi:hypothetical protein